MKLSHTLWGGRFNSTLMADSEEDASLSEVAIRSGVKPEVDLELDD